MNQDLRDAIQSALIRKENSERERRERAEALRQKADAAALAAFETIVRNHISEAQLRTIGAMHSASHLEMTIENAVPYMRFNVDRKRLRLMRGNGPNDFILQIEIVAGLGEYESIVSGKFDEADLFDKLLLGIGRAFGIDSVQQSGITRF